MVIFLIIVLLIIFLDMKVAKPGEFFSDYMSKESTTAVNGLFTILIVLSHASGYLELSGSLDSPYTAFKNYILQMVVASFLFYSGYGIMESIKKKGLSYVKSIPFRRFFKVLYHFDIAILLFIVLNLALGKTLNLKTTLLAFTGWTGVGNSNWYIFAVLFLYIFVFVSFMLARGNKYIGVALVTLLSVAFVWIHIRIGRPSYCYNTVILFPVGMMFSLIKDKFDRIMTKYDVIWFSAAGIFFVLCYIFRLHIGKGIECYSMWGILFMMLLVTVTMKVKINNNILQWFGTHVFSVYILQRIPMIILQHFGLTNHKYAFVVISFAGTIVLATLFDFAIGKLDGLIYSRKKKLPSAPAESSNVNS